MAHELAPARDGTPVESQRPPEARRNQSRTQYVYEKLREAIKSGAYRSGDRVREAEIAKQLNVSRTPVREAINRLISDRLFVESHARGISVASFEQQQVRELYALRETLEGMAARMAAAHAGHDEISAMREILSEAALRFDEPEAQYLLNGHLHEAIYDAAHNRYLSQALHKLADALDLLRGTTYQVPSRPDEAHREHTRIIDAIAKRDADAAETAARAHMREACRVRLRLIFGPRYD